MSKRWVYWLICLNSLDALLTWLAVGTNLAHEVNPIMRWVINSGWVYFLGVKLVVANGLMLLLTKIKPTLAVYFSFILVTMLYVLVVLSNSLGIAYSLIFR